MLERSRRPTASPTISPANGSTCGTSTPPRPTRRSTASSTTSCSGRCRAKRSCSSRRSCSTTCSLTDFVHSDWTFLNQRLAQHYGIAGVSGGEMRKVKLPPGSHRGGVLTQASDPEGDGRRHPDLAGAAGQMGPRPDPRPAAVAPAAGTSPAIEPDIRGATTIRQQLDKHRNTPACASCHRYIDPPGFALESFDVIGGWRDFYRAPSPAGSSSIWPTIRAANLSRARRRAGRHDPRRPGVQGHRRLQALLLADKDQLARNLARSSSSTPPARTSSSPTAR